MENSLLNPIDRDRAEVLRRRAVAPLKPAKEQKACDLGLFSDDAAQIDLVDLTRRAK